MKRSQIVVGLALLCLLFLIGTAAAQDTNPTDPIQFTLLSEDAAVRHGNRGEFDGRYTDPGAALYHDGEFHLFRNGFQAWPASVQIQYMTSPDAINWTADPDEPIIFTDDVSYAGVAALASSALVQDDGTWVLYFYTWETMQGGGAIGRATASDPSGEWTIDPEPILTPGSPNSWDGRQVSAPDVHQTDDGYVMFYAGGGNDQTVARRIGMATSPDGITWTKYDDPDTTDAPFAESDPVFTASGGETWDAADVTQPRVQLTDDGGYVMVYRGQRVMNSPTMNIGIATSPDGIHWSRYENNPVLTLPDMPASAFWYTATAVRDDTTYLFIEFADRGNTTSIWTTAYTGDLSPTES